VTSEEEEEEEDLRLLDKAIVAALIAGAFLLTIVTIGFYRYWTSIMLP
jgi:hypothetical protein